MNRRTRVYVAGPMSIGDQGVNTRLGINVCTRLFEAGYAPFNPFLTHFWHMFAPQPYEAWLDYDFAWVRTCDALLRTPGVSKGADREVEFARGRGIPVFHTFAELKSVIPPSMTEEAAVEPV